MKFALDTSNVPSLKIHYLINSHVGNLPTSQLKFFLPSHFFVFS